MKVVQIVFSPTGGTQKVVDIITSQWENSINKIDLTNIKIDYAALNMEKMIQW